jgi:hypothetical protein
MKNIQNTNTKEVVRVSDERAARLVGEENGKYWTYISKKDRNGNKTITQYLHGGK